MHAVLKMKTLVRPMKVTHSAGRAQYATSDPAPISQHTRGHSQPKQQVVKAGARGTFLPPPLHGRKALSTNRKADAHAPEMLCWWVKQTPRARAACKAVCIIACNHANPALGMSTTVFSSTTLNTQQQLLHKAATLLQLASNPAAQHAINGCRQ